MSQSQRTLWRPKYALAALAGFAGFIAVALLGLQLPPLQRAIIEGAANSALAPHGLHARVDRSGGFWPWRVRARGVHFFDAEGEFLQLDDVELRLRPLSLLAGAPWIDQVNLNGGTYTRRPQLAVREPKPFRLPTFPASLGTDAQLTVQTFELRSFVIAVADQPVEVRGEGRFRLDGNGLDGFASFDADDAGHATLDAQIDARARTIAIDVDVSDAAGRWLTPFTPLAPGTPIEARLNTSGPQDDLVITARSQWGEARFQLDGTADWSETLDLVLTGTLDDALSGNVRAIAGARQDLQTSISVAQNGSVRVSNVSVASATFNGSLHGSLDAELDLEGQITVTDTAAVGAGLGFDDLGHSNILLRVTGPNDRAVIDVTGAVEQLTANGMTLDGIQLRGQSRWSRGGQEADISLEAAIETVAAEWLPDTIAGQAATVLSSTHANFERNRFEVASLSGSWGPLVLDARGALSPSGPMDFEGSVGADDLTSLDPRLTGAGHIEGTLRRARRDAPLQINVNGATEGFAARGELATIIGASPRLVLAALVSAGRVEIEAARLALAAGQVDVSGDMDRLARTLSVEGTFATADLSAFDSGAEGALAGSIRASGPLDTPRIELSATSAALRFHNIALRNFEARLTDDGADSALNLSADEPGGPAALTYPYERSGMDVSGELALTLAGLEVQGPLGFVDGAPQGELEASADDIEELVTLLRGFGGTVDQLRAHGGLVAELSLDGWQGRAAVRVTEPSIEGIDIPAYARQLTLNAEVDFASMPSIDGQLTAEAVEFGPSRFGVIDAKAQGPLADLAASLSLQGPADNPFFLDVEAHRREAGAGSEIVLGAVRGRSLDFEVERIEGGTMTIGPEGTELLPTTFAVRNLATTREGTLRAEARLWAGAPHAQLIADTVPAGALAVFGLPVDWTGILDGEVTLDARGDATPLQVAMMARELTNDPDLPPLDALLTIEANGTALEAQLALNDSADGVPLLTSRSTMPLVWHEGRLSPAVDWQAPLDGFVRANAPLERLWLFVPVDSLGVSGQVTADVTLGGTLSNPLAHGDAQLADGAVEHFRSGFVLRDAHGTLSFDQAGELAADLQGTDGNGGTAHLTAVAHLPQSSQWAVDGSLTLNQLAVARRDELSAQASGELHLTGTLAAARLEGAVTMERIDAQVPNQLPPSVVDLPVVRVNADGTTEEIGKASDDMRTLNAPIELDVTIDVPRRAFVRGRGLDSEWSGALALRGTVSQPRLDGTVSIVRGTFDLSRTRFDLTEGSIQFLGGDRIDPQIRVQGEAPGPDFTSIIRASGPARRPTFTITSDPVMPQETVMAQILFGKRPEELSAFELVQIGEATASLSGSGGFDFLGSARRAAGLDVLSIGARETAAGEQDVNLTVGRYVAPNVFVGARRGFEPGSGAVTVEMEVTPQVTVDAEVRQDAEGSVGVDWRWDY